MSLEPLWSGSELLRKLLDDFLEGKLKIDTFCRDVEAAYNDAIDEGALTPSEQPIFEKLFDEVAWFSPFPEERAEVPHLRNDEQILRAARAAKAELSRNS
jgi:hypothetical protein